MEQLAILLHAGKVKILVESVQQGGQTQINRRALFLILIEVWAATIQKA